jgi:very-short-patch-repair endonuclease
VVDASKRGPNWPTISTLTTGLKHGCRVGRRKRAATASEGCVTNIRATATMHRREMNHTEEKYSRHLQDRLLCGEIRWWAFECWKLRLADNTFYTPDFIVVDNALRIEAHEVKHWWRNAGRTGWEEDARVKIKVAADMHPIRFVAATLMEDQSWSFEEFQKDREEPLPPTDLELISQALGLSMVARDWTDIVHHIQKLREASRV